MSNTGFEKFQLNEALIKAIKDLGYPHPTTIQKKVIPQIMNNMDVIAASKSGTGKTASYILPILHKLSKMIKPNNRVIRSLILVPTRELVDQVSLNLTELGKHLKIKHTKIYGGSSKASQIEKLSSGIDIIVATPGRLKEFVDEELIDLGSVNLMVLDEADTMLEMGFIKDIEYIFSQCSLKRQIIMCSATISQNIKKLGKEFLSNPVSVEVSQRRDVVQLIDHRSFKVDKKRKAQLLTHLIQQRKNDQILVFVNQKETADIVEQYLKSKKVNVAKIHGDVVYNDRAKAVKNFRNGKLQVLLATDVAARGLDIKELPLVINYDLPEATDDFTHRCGRTGRANQKGEAYTLLTTTDYNHFTKIERNLRLSIKREVLDGFELTDRQPRQKQQKKKKLSEKKGRVNPQEKKKNLPKKKYKTKRDL